MKRKDFIRNISFASIPLIFKGIPVYALNGFSEPVLEVFNGINSDSDRILVIIQLNGGNDGLNTVIPLDKYSQIAAARPDIMLPQSAVLSLDGNSTTGLHPAMSGLRDLYNNGRLAIVQGVSYPNPSFSHFHAQDIWFTGAGVASVEDTGWMGRSLERKFPDYPDGYPNSTYPDPPSIQIGGVMPLSLQGSKVNMGYNVPNPSSLIDIVNETSGDVPDSDYGTELSFVRLMKSQSNVFASNVKMCYNAQNTLSEQYPAGGNANTLANQLKIVARLIGGGLKTPVYIVNHENSFDTHASQVSGGDKTKGTHANLLEKLSVAVSAFMDDLTLMGKADKVIGMTYSEFGRRVINNASSGTDHGTAAPMFVFGTNVNPGMYGDSPDLPDNPNVNTQVNTQFDYRQVYTTMMQDWLGIDKTTSGSVLNGDYQTINFINKGNTGENDTPLPIDAIQLSVNQRSQQDDISFTAYSNHYYEKFLLEISLDGTIFSTVKDIRQTTNETLKTYNVTLDRRNEARVYYRIKGISKQQEVAYSNIVVIKNRDKQFFSIFPNPVTNFTFYISFIEIPASNITIEVFDVRGVRLFYNQYPPAGRIQVLLPDMFELHQLHIVKVGFDKEQIAEKIFFK